MFSVKLYMFNLSIINFLGFQLVDIGFGTIPDTPSAFKVSGNMTLHLFLATTSRV